MRLLTAVVVLFFGAINSVQAAPIKPLVGLGIAFGGDSIIEAQYDDGSSTEIGAGQGASFYGGVLVPSLQEFSTGSLEIQATLGIKTTSTKKAKNGEIGFTRIPLELLGAYRLNTLPLRFLGGFAYSPSNTIKGEGDFKNIDIDLGDTMSLVVGGDFLFSENNKAAVGVRFEMISFEPEDSGSTVDGNNIGVHLSYMWL